MQQEGQEGACATLTPQKCNNAPYFQGLQIHNLVQPQNLRTKFLRGTDDPDDPCQGLPAPPPLTSGPTSLRQPDSKQRLHGHGRAKPPRGTGKTPSPCLRGRVWPMPDPPRLSAGHLGSKPTEDTGRSLAPPQVGAVPRVCHCFDRSNPDDPDPIPRYGGAPPTPTPRNSQQLSVQRLESHR